MAAALEVAPASDLMTESRCVKSHCWMNSAIGKADGQASQPASGRVGALETNFPKAACLGRHHRRCVREAP